MQLESRIKIEEQETIQAATVSTAQVPTIVRTYAHMNLHDTVEPLSSCET